MQTYQILLLSVAAAVLIIGTYLYLNSSKVDETSIFYLSSNAKVSPRMRATINLFGGDMLALAPDKFKSKSMSSKMIDDLFMEASNPWGVSKIEFFVIRLTYLFIGLLLTIAIALFMPTPLFLNLIIGGAVSFALWNQPVSAYRKVAERRKSEFKYHLPEALDYLGMTMAGSKYSLPNAIELILEYMDPSAVRDEFALVSDSIKSGMSTEQALMNMADRVPDHGVQSFVKSMNNANVLSVPLDKILAARSSTSRKDLKFELEEAIEKMTSKIQYSIGLPAIISILVIVAAPSASALRGIL